MPPLYLVKQNSKLRLQNRRLSVIGQTNGIEETLVNVPIGQVSEVVICGNIGITTPTMSYCLANQIPIIFLSEDGIYKGQLVGEISPHVPLRRKQYELTGHSDYCLKLSKSIITAKITHQRNFLLRHKDESHDLEKLLPVLIRLKTSIQEIERKTTLDSLRGLEGSSSAAYFGALRTLFSPQWKFEKRIRRPPTDPVNVLLSFGYTLLSRMTAAAVQAVGLDPFAGFYHTYAYNRPTLALDLMEEFRPVIDGVVLSTCQNNILKPDDFVPGDNDLPIRLSDSGMRNYITQLENRFNRRFTHPIRNEQLTLRQCIIEQARQLVICINENKTDFIGMGFR